MYLSDDKCRGDSMNRKKVNTIVSYVVVMALLLVGCGLTNKIAKSGGTVWG